VITTVVSSDPGWTEPEDAGDDVERLSWDWDAEAPEPLPVAEEPIVAESEAPPPVPELATEPPKPPAPRLPAPEPAPFEERLVALEEVPARVETLGKAIRHELERCAGVLFAHDRALGTLATRLDALGPQPASADAAGTVAPPASEESIARVVEQVDGFAERLAAMEARVVPLEPLPTVVQALRRAVRASDDLITGESAAREQALAALASEQGAEAQARDDALRRLVAQDLDRVSGVSNAQAKALTDFAERLAAVEARLAPLDSVPDDVAALSRIMRRELDAVVADNQARDQMLRRALQGEIDQMRATSEAREALAQQLTARLDALEGRSTEVAEAHDQALGVAGGRLEGLETRIAEVDRLSAELEVLRDTLGKELEQLRSGGQTHDQVAGELTRRLAALDGRLARLDAVPGEVQSLRTAMLQEAERTVSSLRAADERIGQLSWVPAEFQEARKRIMALTSGLAASQDKVRQLEGALGSTTERLDALRARVSAAAPPGPPG
jgi:DNA repair exonuclease SbcCD ATPase subunit